MEASNDQTPDLRGELSRAEDAAQAGIVSRDLDPIEEIGDPDDLVPGEIGDADDDEDVEDRDDTGRVGNI